MWRWVRNIFLILLGVFVLWAVYEILTFPNVIKLRTENPQTTSLIEARLKQATAEGKPQVKQMIWVPIDKISPNLQRAVLAGEDTRFFEHNGFDWDAINKSWEEAKGEAEKEAKDEGDNDPDNWIPPLNRDGFWEYIYDNFGLPSPENFKRGASTISQQLVKNLYLSEERSFFRKGREAAITYVMERNVPKKRILEIYLNVIEWGDGIYGCEAASRKYFGKSASQLSPDEAAYLSAMIPSPLNVFNPNKNPRRLKRRQNVIRKGMNYIKLPY
jgi:monofunctional biosynthetic peptidoglycan transglycosylase